MPKFSKTPVKNWLKASLTSASPRANWGRTKKALVRTSYIACTDCEGEERARGKGLMCRQRYREEDYDIHF